MSRQNVDLGSGSVGKLLFSLAVPTITSQIVNMLYNLVDRVYIGHMQPVETVGKLALTGVGVCLPIIMAVSAFAALLAMGGAPRASIQEGRGSPREAERIMGNSFTLLLAVSLVLTAVFYLGAEPLLLLLYHLEQGEGLSPEHPAPPMAPPGRILRLDFTTGHQLLEDRKVLFSFSSKQYPQQLSCFTLQL